MHFLRLKQRSGVAALVAALVLVPAASAEGAYVAKRAARDYLRHAIPPAAPRVLLGDERAGFFRTQKLWIEAARNCRRDSAVAVVCRMSVRLVPDAAHRARNWWPIRCRGEVLVSMRSDGKLAGDQLDYVCRSVRS